MATHTVFNPFTGELDFVGSDEELAAYVATFLKLDQSTPQHVVNGAPRFDGEAALNTPAIVIKSGQRLVFDGA